MDRKILTNLILAAALACAAPEYISAQEYTSTPVTVSKEKVRVDGKICYSHIVKEKQTLFSIAKAYGVSVDDIYAFNPSLKESGLKKNSIILIPSQEALAAKGANADAAKEEVAAETAEAVKEEPGEEKKEEVREGKRKQTIHTVKWYEDLDMIAEKYGVTVAHAFADPRCRHFILHCKGQALVGGGSSDKYRSKKSRGKSCRQRGAVPRRSGGHRQDQ